MPDEYPPYPGPPHSAGDEQATDPWGWLYRDESDEPAPVVRRDDRPPADPPADDAGTAGYATTVYAPEDYPGDYPGEDGHVDEYGLADDRAEEYGRGNGAEPYAYGPAAGVIDAASALAPDVRQPQRRRKGGLLAAIVVGAIALVAGLIVVVLLVLRSLGGPTGTMPYQGTTTPSTDTSASQPAGPTSGPPTFDGNVAPIAATGASAKCVAPDAKDGAGHTVSYAPGNVNDEDPGTAWRCDGDGVGQAISIDLPKNSTVVRVGLINGYAKVDPESHQQRYPEYRRITEVRWTFSNGATFDQHLSDGIQAVQYMNLPVQKGVSQARVTIVSSTDPGQNDPTRNAVLISTIQIGKPA